MLRARVLRWKPWATVLGLDAQYRLDRFDSSYRDIAEARATPPSVEDLRPSAAPSSISCRSRKRSANGVPLVDTPEHGQAVYWPMADGRFTG